MAFSVLLPWGLPLLAAVGAAIAVGAVRLAAHFLRTSAWGAVGQLIRPLSSIGRALLPLSLPVMVILLFATRDLAFVLQFLAGAALAGLIWLYFRGESEFEHERSQLLALGARTRAGLAPGNRVRSVTRSALPWAVIAALGGLVFAFLAGFAWQISAWDSFAGASGDAELVGLLLLSIALPFRLFGYATNWYRAGASLVLALLLAQILILGGVLRHIAFLGIFDLGWFSIILVAAFLVVLVAEAVLVPAPAPPGPFHQGGRAWGLATACLSALGLAIALGIAAAQTTGGAQKLGSYPTTLSPRIVNTYGGPDTDLAWTFAPLFHLEHKERYGPTGVASFLSQAHEAGPTKMLPPGQKLAVKTLPTVCPDGSHAACGTLECAPCYSTVTAHPIAPTPVPEGVLYARVVHRRTDPQVFSGWNPWGRKLQTLVQYWIFYLYDSWQTETVIGKVTQEHQGDWEFVAVGLDRQNKPLFLALSAHCAGQVVDWSSKLPAAPGHLVNGRIVITDKPGPGDEVTHPIVAVARGSHANYARSGDNRPPDWGSCSNLPSGALTAFSYASNVRDLTEQGSGGWFAYPRLVSVVESAHGKLGRPFSYPGSWGTGEFITFAHRGRKHSGDGPKSPPLQGKSWDTPVHFFFCGAYWQGDHRGTAAECRQ